MPKRREALLYTGTIERLRMHDKKKTFKDLLFHPLPPSLPVCVCVCVIHGFPPLASLPAVGTFLHHFAIVLVLKGVSACERV